ncbi:MAG: amino acid decarboxylase [Clostridia bacterium]|nr:amino acid decarboxylase [Clostridia bacterium]
MKTPIYDFVQNYIQSNTARFHMPGHKGTSFLGCEAGDITEIEGADVLYSPCGIIEESELNATALFGTAHTFYSTEGSSLAIRAMLALVREQSEEEPPLILAARNAHKAFVYGCALLDLQVEWMYSAQSHHVCDATITPRQLQARLAKQTKKPSAVYVTSPDYLGNVSDIAGLAAVCDAYDVPLLVDNAHGAYLGFLQESLHPIALGATLCCDSAHKTLPVLTGGAYLHVSPKAPRTYVENARKVLSVFASTSPSYLILQSLDLCNPYIAGDYRDRLAECVRRVRDVKEHLQKRGFHIRNGEPLKIVIDAKMSGYLGSELASVLKSQGIESEFSDPDFLVLMATPENDTSDFDRLKAAFESIKPRGPISRDIEPIGEPHTVLSLRQAVLSPSETIPLDDAVGRICAAPTVACPPAVPIVISGERITETHVRAMKYYGHEQIEVIKKTVCE